MPPAPVFAASIANPYLIHISVPPPKVSLPRPSNSEGCTPFPQGVWPLSVVQDNLHSSKGDVWGSDSRKSARHNRVSDRSRPE